MGVETLPEVPSLGPLFARGVLSARGRHGDALPDRTLRVEDVRIERERLTAYQRLCGYAVSDVVPQPYPWVLAFPIQTALMARPDFPVALPGMVHLANRVATHRPIHASDRLSLTVSTPSLTPHRKGRVLDARIEATVDGELVWECESRYLSPGRGSEDAPAGNQPPAPPTGQAVAQWSLPDGLGREYAGVSGDINPIHLHPLTARTMGFRRHIAHGMWSYARTLAALGRDSLGPSTSEVWFTKPIFLPSRVALVVEREAGLTTAALRSVRAPETSHLVLTLQT